MEHPSDTQRGLGDPTTFSVALAVARIEERMDAIADARAERDAAMQAAIKESIREALAPLSGRVGELEESVKRVKWIGAVLTAVAGAVWWAWANIVKPMGLVGAVASLGSCALPPPASPATELHWCAPERPAHVIVSDATTPECQAAVRLAVAFWASHGADYLTFAVVPDATLTPEVPMPTFIQVVAEPPLDPGATGETSRARITASCVLAAETKLEPHYCAPGANTAAHELGHALGLNHVTDDPNNLMWPVNLPGGFALTEEQLAQVR